MAAQKISPHLLSPPKPSNLHSPFNFLFFFGGPIPASLSLFSSFLYYTVDRHIFPDVGIQTADFWCWKLYSQENIIGQLQPKKLHSEQKVDLKLKKPIKNFRLAFKLRFFLTQFLPYLWLLSRFHPRQLNTFLFLPFLITSRDAST